MPNLNAVELQDTTMLSETRSKDRTEANIQRINCAHMLQQFLPKNSEYNEHK
jgi:hypothetical protein